MKVGLCRLAGWSEKSGTWALHIKDVFERHLDGNAFLDRYDDSHRKCITHFELLLREDIFQVSILKKKMSLFCKLETPFIPLVLDFVFLKYSIGVKSFYFPLSPQRLARQR